jgi:hypothetical protein
MNLENENIENDQDKKSIVGTKKFMGFLILGGIPLLFVLYLVLGPFLDILRQDIKAKDMFVISDFVNVRSDSAANSLKMGELTYGTMVPVYEINKEWAKVLVDGRKVYLSSDFLVEPEVFYTIEGIFGDTRAADLVKGSKYRLALYRYFVAKGFASDIPADIKEKYFKESSGKEIYKIMSEPKGSRYSSVVYADFDGDFTQDAALILSHKGSDNKILVIFSFDKKDPLNINKVIYENELEESWMAIKLAKKGSSYKINTDSTLNEKTKIPVNGLLIGSNRSKSLKDPVQLLFYDGKNFDMYKVEDDN